MLNTLQSFLRLHNSETDWEVEPYLTNTVNSILDTARADGDDLRRPRLLKHSLRFSSQQFATTFESTVDSSYKTLVFKYESEETWCCDCDRIQVPAFATLHKETRTFWIKSLTLSPTLSAVVTMYDPVENRRWEVVPPTLIYT